LDDLKKWKTTNPETEIALVLNKQDLAKLPLTARTQKLNSSGIYSTTFAISALRYQGLDPLLEYLFSKSIPGNWEFTRESVTDQSKVALVEEVIREKIFRLSNQEIPYVTEQENIGWTTLADGTLRIDQYLIVPKASQRGILIGKERSKIHEIERQATETLKKMWNIDNLLLVLTVKSRKKK